MKHIDGRSLDDLLLSATKRFPIPVAQTILTEVARALDYAHREGVIPPRYQAREHHGGSEGQLHRHGLRHRARGGHAALHADGRDDRHAGVHESGAVPRLGDERSKRSILAGNSSRTSCLRASAAVHRHADQNCRSRTCRTRRCRFATGAPISLLNSPTPSRGCCSSARPNAGLRFAISCRFFRAGWSRSATRRANS